MTGLINDGARVRDPDCLMPSVSSSLHTSGPIPEDGLCLRVEPRAPWSCGPFVSFRLAAAPDPSPGVPGAGAHPVEVPQLEKQVSVQGHILPGRKTQEIFPYELQLLHPSSERQSQWLIPLHRGHRADAALVPARGHRCPRWEPELFKELQALEGWVGRGLLVFFSDFSTCVLLRGPFDIDGSSECPSLTTAMWCSSSFLKDYRKWVSLPWYFNFQGIEAIFSSSQIRVLT